jgi:hypothetical protein
VLQEAHNALEAMSAACTAIKVEEWSEAERSLHQVQETVGRLLREVGEKSRKTMLASPADKGHVREEE